MLCYPNKPEATPSPCTVPHTSSQCAGSGPESLHPDTSVLCSSTEQVSQNVFDVALKQCRITKIPHQTLKNMWSKAERLVRANGTILKVPWSSDAKARLVMSSSSEHPHLVKMLESWRCGHIM